MWRGSYPVPSGTFRAQKAGTRGPSIRYGGPRAHVSASVAAEARQCARREVVHERALERHRSRAERRGEQVHALPGLGFGLGFGFGFGLGSGLGLGLGLGVG